MTDAPILAKISSEIAHERLQFAAQQLTKAKNGEDGLADFVDFWQEKYDFWYQQYTNPFKIDKRAPAVTPTN